MICSYKHVYIDTHTHKLFIHNITTGLFKVINNTYTNNRCRFFVRLSMSGIESDLDNGFL